MYKHYIRVNEKNEITAAFSFAFEKPTQDDICITDNAERHFNLQLTTMRGVYKYKYIDSKIVERTQAEIDALEKPMIDKQNAISELAKLDAKAVRPLRAIAAGTATQEDRDYIASLEIEAERLRGIL